MRCADPRAQRHPQTLKDSAHGDTELSPTRLALKEAITVALLLATDPEDL
jgi:hypothetical protein